MNFQSFWQILCKQVSQTKEFSTLKRHTKFSAVYSNGMIIVKPNTPRFQRPIHSNEFAKVWQKAKSLSIAERFNPVNYQDQTFHASYILALMKFIIQDGTIE